VSETIKKSPNVSSSSDEGGYVWDYIDEILASDNIRAFSNMAGHMVSECIYASDFRFNVPAGATIDGVEIMVEARCDPADQGIAFMNVSFFSGGYESNNLADDETLTTSDVKNYFGGSSEKGGIGAYLTPANVNRSDFEVSCYFVSPNYLGTIEVDSITVTIYFTDSVGNVDEVIAFVISSTLGLAETVGGGAFDSLNFEIAGSLSATPYIGFQETLTFEMGAFAEMGHTAEKTAVRMVLDDGTIYNIELLQADSIIEEKYRDSIQHRYSDNSVRVYYVGADVRRWRLLIVPDSSTVGLIEALRKIETTVRFYPDYYRNKGTYYYCRIDNRAPLYYAAGHYDKEKFLQLVVYEIDNSL
jgi:hypothetical protein